jgi:ketosteroid isomerase-like protein
MLPCFRHVVGKLHAKEMVHVGTESFLDPAFERGRYDITIAPRAGGEAMDDIGKYITVYQRQADGSWKIARDIWNSDRPLPGTR